MWCWSNTVFFSYWAKNILAIMVLAEDVDAALREAGLTISHMPWLCVAAHCQPNSLGLFGEHLHLESGALGSQGAVFVELVCKHLHQSVSCAQLEAAKSALDAVSSGLVCTGLQATNTPDQFEAARSSSAASSAELASSVSQETDLDVVTDDLCSLNSSIMKFPSVAWNCKHAFNAITGASIMEWSQLAAQDVTEDLKVGLIWKELMLAVLTKRDSTVNFKPGSALVGDTREIFEKIPKYNRLQNLWACCSCYLLQCLGLGKWFVEGSRRPVWQFYRFKLNAAWWDTSAALAVVGLGLHLSPPEVFARCIAPQGSADVVDSRKQHSCRGSVWSEDAMGFAFSFLGLPTLLECRQILENWEKRVLRSLSESL